jgi:Tfp pilus assembly protein PilF
MLLALTGLVFGRVVTHDFLLLDDPPLIYQNAAFNPATWAGVMNNWREVHMGIYMPVSYMAWGAVAAIARRAADPRGTTLNPAYFHALNLTLHLLSAVGVFVLLRRILPRVTPIAAALGAAVFALHPLQVEAVAWAGDGMYAVLSGALSIWALCVYVSFARAADSRRRRWTCASVATLLFALAMLSKPSAISVPLIAIVIDLLLLRRDWRRVLPLPIAWGAAGGVFILISSRLQESAYIQVPLAWRPLVALDAIGFYLAKVLAPLWLSPDYARRPVWVITHLGQGLSSATFACVAILLGVALWRYGRRVVRAGRDSQIAMPLAAAAAVFVLALVPFLGVKPLLFQWYSTVADRYTYLSLLGAAIAVAAVVHARPRLVAPALVLVLALGTAAAIQVGRWRDSRTLFTYAAAIRPDGLLTNGVLADDAMDRGDYADAERHFLAAMAARSDDPKAPYRLGRLMLDQGRNELAAQYFVRAIFCAPSNPDIHTDLGVAFLHMGRVREAEAEFHNAITIAERGGKPSGEAWQNLGVIYAHTGRPAEAKNALEQALAIDSTLRLARQQLDALGTETAGTDPAAR